MRLGVTLGQRVEESTSGSWFVSLKVLEAIGQDVSLGFQCVAYLSPSLPLAHIYIIPLQGLGTLPWGIPSSASV